MRRFAIAAALAGGLLLAGARSAPATPDERALVSALLSRRIQARISLADFAPALSEQPLTIAMRESLLAARVAQAQRAALEGGSLGLAGLPFASADSLMSDGIPVLEAVEALLLSAHRNGAPRRRRAITPPGPASSSGVRPAAGRRDPAGR